jgi:hypothetical protein
MSHATTGYVKPRCPKCRKLLGRKQGYDLVEIKRTKSAVTIRCRLCHYQWRSTNQAARGGVLKTQEVSRA